MTWTDRFQDLSATNWAGIGLLCLNFAMLPFLFFSGGSPEYYDGDYPSVELLQGDSLIQAKAFETQHTTSPEVHNAQQMHDTHSQSSENHEKKIVGASHESIKSRHDVPLHASHDTTTENQHETKREDTGHKQRIKTKSKDPLARVCYEVGPLKSDDEQIKLQNLVEIKGMFVSVKYTRSNENLGYWVFIPPLRSKPLARLKVEELKLNGFNDVVLLTRNEPLNAVSLGVFSDQKNAYKHMLRAQSLGFDAKMDIRYQSLGEMWLSVEVNQGKDLDDEGWGELIKDYPHVQIHHVNCS